MKIEIIRPTDAPLEHLITPHFMHLNVENVPQSRIKGEYVGDIREVVQLRFAGDKNFSPVLPVDAVYASDGVNQITYAERFAKQYQQFLAGDAQIADGTPLERLVSFGITPAQISLCRALKIHTVEAVAHLEGTNLKASGAVVANVIKPMARRYLDDRASGSQAQREIEALRAEIAAMKAGSVVIPADEQAEAAKVPALEAEIDEAEALKARYAELTGQRPRGNPKVETLRMMVSEAEAA